MNNKHVYSPRQSITVALCRKGNTMYHFYSVHTVHAYVLLFFLFSVTTKQTRDLHRTLNIPSHDRKASGEEKHLRKE